MQLTDQTLLNGKSAGVKTGAFKKKQKISTNNGNFSNLG
jgi:hypothetical protein